MSERDSLGGGASVAGICDDRPVDEFDLLIIGAGSGNTIPDERFRSLRIAIADDAPWFGGTCLNVGCIPSKMFLRVAEIASLLEEGRRLGLDAARPAVDWPAVRERIFGRIDPISRGGEEYRRTGEPNITLIRETLRFTGPHELRAASGRRLRADRIVIAAGARPRALPALPWSNRVLSSNEILRLDALPANLVVVGGGVVAAEFASLFHGLGVEVTQLVRSGLLRHADPELQRRFTAAAGEQWRLREDVAVSGSRELADGVELRLSDGTTLRAELVLVAAGRVPNSDLLDTAAAGFDHHADGRLAVDRYQRVLSDGEPVPGVFALGDIDQAQQLKHVANHEARIVQRNLLAGPDAPESVLAANTLGPIPHAVFSHPQLAWFGHTLERAAEDGLDAIEVVQEYAWTAWGWALEAREGRDGVLKLVVDRPSGRILGAHLIGPDAAILLQPLLQAASLGIAVQGLARGQYWPHPAATEIVENALLRAEAALTAAPETASQTAVEEQQ